LSSITLIAPDVSLSSGSESAARRIDERKEGIQQVMKDMHQVEASEETGPKVRPLTQEEIAELVDKAIRSFESALEGAGGKCSVSDLVRLLQLRKELAGDTPGNVTVRWVDECNETSSER
jgi:hypothetical protein